jgi:DUF4097 and DUF4098 domain-containing protein YvlB
MLKKVALAAGIVCLAGVIGLASIGFTKDGLSIDKMVGKQISFDKNKAVKGEDISKIKVDVASADVKVIPGDDDEITVHFYGKGNKKGIDAMKLDVEQNGKDLSIRVKQKGIIFFTNMSAHLDISVPQKLYKQLDAKTASGNIKIENLQIDQLKAHAASGDISISDIFSKDINVNVSSGDIYAENVEGDIKTDTSSGDTYLLLNTIDHDIEMEAASGDIKVEVRNEPNDFTLDYAGSSGDGKVSLPMNYDVKTDDEIRGKAGSGKHMLKVRTSSGDFSLNKK